MSFGHLMLDLAGLTLLEEEKELIQHPEVGGIIFFARNFSSVQQITQLVVSIRAIRPEILLCVDQEGGRVQRFKEGFTTIPPMQLLGSWVEKDSTVLEFVSDIGWLMAVELIACGIDFSFAPVLDIDRQHCEVIANRAFGDTPETVITTAGAFIDGMHQAGMAATGKHFPGHGGVSADSHLATPFDERSLGQMLDRDIKPFAALADKLQGIMPAHIVFPNVDENAVGFSPLWLQDVLRSQLGYSGIIFSDDLSMKGADIAGDYIDKAKSALIAGCDMVLVCNERAGALEVLAFLEQQALNKVDLTKMAAQKQWAWPQLHEHRRWVKTRSKLEEISANSL